MPTVLVGGGEQKKGADRAGPGRGSVDSDRAWRWIGWFALALGVAGVSDLVLAWIPPRLGNPQWEFSTVAQSMSGLPLVTIGLAGLLASGLARRTTWLIGTTAAALAIAGSAIVAALMLFWPNAGMALDQTTGNAAIDVRRTVAKTMILGLTFGTAYLVGAIAAFRHVLRTRRE